MLRKIISISFLSLLFASMITAASSAQMRRMPANHNRELQEARAATAKYQDVRVALRDGYRPERVYVSVPGIGGMGIHYKNTALIKAGVVDPRSPQALVYVPERNGQMRLVALEYVVPAYAKDQNGRPITWTAGHLPPRGWANSAPKLFGRRFDPPMPGNEPGDPWVYTLHAWIWQNNPKGIFEPYNPAVPVR